MAHDPYAPKHNPDAEVIEPPAFLRRQDQPGPPTWPPTPRAARSGHPDFDALAKVIDNAVESINARQAEHSDADPLDDLAEDFTRIPILRAIELAKGIVEVMGGDTKPDSVELAVAMAKWGEQRKQPKVAA